MEGWETLIYRLKLAIDSGLHCNGMEAINWRRW